MEEIEFKLNQNNAMLVTQAISKLMGIIKQKKLDNLRKNIESDLDIEELHYLVCKCGNENPLVCISACHGMVSLVKNGILSIKSTFTDLIMTFTYAKCPLGITTAVCNLLFIEMKRELDVNEKYVCPYTLQKSQHPIITILAQKPEVWREVYNKIEFWINHFNDRIAENSIELLRPVFFYIFCDPNTQINYMFRNQLWNLFCLKDDVEKIQQLQFEILGWIQMNSKEKCLELQDYMIESLKYALAGENVDVCPTLILYLTSIMHELTKYGCDPGPSINIIVETLNITNTSYIHSILLMILSDTILICPPIYLAEVLQLCKLIISNQNSNVFAVKSLVATLLQWLLCPSKLFSEAVKIASEIIFFTENNNKYSTCTANLFQDSYFSYIQFSNPHIDLLIKLCLMGEKWQVNETLILGWFNNITRSPKFFLSQIFTFISSIFINKFQDHAINLKALEVLLKFIQNNKEKAYNVLVLLLYKLSNELDPEFQLKLLNTLPLMASSKQNIPIIINTLEVIRKGPIHLKSISFELFFNLWITEVRCFPYLQNLFLENIDHHEFGIAKANVLKKICDQRPDLHGKDMIVHLSNILNNYSDESGSTATALALQGVTILCEAGVIDLISTWETISPKFLKDTRPLVIKSLCEFLSVYSKINSITIDDEAKINDVLRILWNYVVNVDNEMIIEAALKAISCFNVEQLSLKVLPKIFQEKVKIPSDYAKISTVDSVKKPDDVLSHIPGECWIQLLQKINYSAMDAVRNLLIEWTKIEIAEYKSGVYQIIAGGKPEPTDYNYLPSKSIVRGIGNALRTYKFNSASKFPLSEQVIIQCLKILGTSYLKPLPPINWRFARELMNINEEISLLVLNILCKQVTISETATKIIKETVNNLRLNVDSLPVLHVLFSNLNYLCRHLPQNALRPLILDTLKFSYNLTGEIDYTDDCIATKTFICLTKQMKVAFFDDEISKVNRTSLGQIVEIFSEEIDASDPLFNNFIECVIASSSVHREKISCPSLWPVITDEKLKKAMKVQSAMAKNCKIKPMLWVNECLNVAAKTPSVHIFAYEQIAEILEQQYEHSSISDWILEMLGRVQQKLTLVDKNMEEIMYFCNMFLLGMLICTGYEYAQFPFELTQMEDLLSVFPNALYTYLKHHQGITVHVLEWLHHMIKGSDEIPLIYKNAYFHATIMLRHEKGFCESSRWMKYVITKP